MGDYSFMEVCLCVCVCVLEKSMMKEIYEIYEMNTRNDEVYKLHHAKTIINLSLSL